MAQAGLERSCKQGFRDGLSLSAPEDGIERIEARFRGNGFSPHRHDTYALGLTLHGIQTFRYRGEARFSMPGKVIVLHPDELHDGAAGTQDGLIYRMLYLPPELVGAASGHLPFLRDPVVEDGALWRALAQLLGDLQQEPDELALDDAIGQIAARLAQQAGSGRSKSKMLARPALLQASDLLVSESSRTIRSQALEDLVGLDRYELARQFRLLFGTSPHRYRIMRRLDHAKRLLRAGAGLAEAAAEAGFADQAHFTRHFRNSFGLTPGRWVGMRDSA
ncbi:AraC-type DNA-binding protein [Xaviernesmea oryzae]|nr:AraC-type DNA-binding protein [Xaviernesmea oryzae]